MSKYSAIVLLMFLTSTFMFQFALITNFNDGKVSSMTLSDIFMDDYSQPEASHEYESRLYNHFINYEEEEILAHDQIFGHKYIQMNENTTWNFLEYQMMMPKNNFDPEGQPFYTAFKDFSLKYNNLEVLENEQPNGPQIYPLNSTQLNEFGVHTANARVFSKIANKWLNYQTIINITSDISVFPYYNDLYVQKMSNPSDQLYLSWDIYRPMNTSISYEFKMDGSVLYTGSGYLDIIDFFIDSSFGLDTIGRYNASFTVTDDSTGKTTTNNFRIYVVGPNNPKINYFHKESNNVKLWETQTDRLFTVRAEDSDLDPTSKLDKIEIYVLPGEDFGYNLKMGILYHTIENAENEIDYEIPLSHPKLFDIIKKLYLEQFDNNQNQNFWELYRNLRFRAIARDKSYKWSMNLDNYDNMMDLEISAWFFKNMKQQNLFIRAGDVNISTIELEDSIYSWSGNSPYIADKLDYSITTIANAKTSARLNIRAIGSNSIQGGSPCIYRYYREEQQYQECNPFVGFNTQSGYRADSGIYFWLNPENGDSINYPITMRINYPSDIEPNEDLGESPLRLLKWIPHESNQYDIYSYEQEGKWELVNQNDVVISGTNQNRISIHEPGLYGFGKYLGDYEDYYNQGMGIPGFPFEIIMLSLSFAIIFAVLRIKKNICNVI